MQVFGCVQVRKLPECSSGVLNLAGTQAGRQAGGTGSVWHGHLGSQVSAGSTKGRHGWSSNRQACR